MTTPLISLLTDFGSADPSVGICRGVIWRIAPTARLLDISHAVPHYDIRHGAVLLWSALPYLPPAVHLAVVDPGVGTERRPIVLRTARGDHLVGPDNGLLLPAAERLGGAVAAHQLERAEYRLSPVSQTFHARDVFAPAAAHLALGVPVEAFGRALPIESLVRLPWPGPATQDGCLAASVIFVDAFGNAQLLAGLDDLEAAVGALSPGDRLRLRRVDGGELAGGREAVVPWQLTFGDASAGEPLLCRDSYERLCLAVNQGDAAAHFGLEPESRIEIRRA